MCSRPPFRGARNGRRSSRPCSRLCRGQAGPAGAGLRRPAAVLGRDDERSRHRGRCGARFDHVLVDEYQDTNRLQSAILLAMKPDGRGLTVVGDDAQSIYSFRAATVRNILDFPTQFPKPARVVTLDRNYRSTQPILNASNAVIGLAAGYARISGPTGNPRSCRNGQRQRRGRAGALGRRPGAGAARSGRHAQVASGAVPFGQP